MREALIDTDILSEIMEGKNDGVVRFSRQYYRVFRRYTISAITLLEIQSGLTYDPKAKDLENFAAIQPLLEILPVGADEATTAGQITGLLKASGMTIERFDPIIAATAIEQDMPLITGNTRHHQRVVDLGFPLTLENWRDPA